MKKKFLFLICVLSLCISSNLIAGKAIRVLFLGNSYTQVNNLPSIIAQMANSTGDTVIYDASTPGGHTLQMHRNNATSLSKMAIGNWDFVVLQEQSQLPSFPDAQVMSEVYPFAKALDSIVRSYNRCTETLFYMTWGRKNGDASNCTSFPPVCTYEGMDSLLRLRYYTMTEDNEAIVSPVGAVWRYLRTFHPEIELYTSDESHPSMAGSYAAGCAFYSVLFRQDPEDITYTGSLPESVATTIRNAAKQIVYDSLAYWKVGVYDPMASFTYTQDGNTVTLTNTSINSDSMKWDFGDGIISYELNPSHIYSLPGTYYITLTAAQCGYSDTYIDTVVIEPTSIHVNKGVEIQLYPNPATNYILFTNEHGTPLPYVILDNNGTVIEKGMMKPGEQKINLDKYATGVYYFRLMDKRAATASFTFIVK